MMKFVLVLVLSFLIAIPVYCNDNLSNKNQELGVVAGQIWNKRHQFNIEQVNVNEAEIEVIVENISSKKQNEIRNSAYPYNVKFVNVEPKGKDNYIKTREFILSEGIPYIKSKGMVFETQNSPYMQNGFLMIPLRSAFKILDNASEHIYEIKWVGGDEKIVELLTGSGVPIQLSLKNNTLTSLPNNITYNLDGKIEICNGTTFFPCSIDNVRLIFPSVKIIQDFEGTTVEIMS